MTAMDIGVYRQQVEKLVREALGNSDRSISGISEYLSMQEVKGLIVRHKTEKRRALEDVRKAFDEHRNWPLNIILSHLGLDSEELLGK